jgi:hypothetical protein
MFNDLDPIVGNWYRHLDKGQMFTVVAVDEATGVAELQQFDGNIEEVDLGAWSGMDLELAEAPEDWTGPTDDIERDDLGYSETAMSSSEWRKPLEEMPRDEKETWEEERSKDEDLDRDQTNQPEELPGNEEIENTDAKFDY